MIRAQAAHPKVFFFGLYADLFRYELLGKCGDCCSCAANP